MGTHRHDEGDGFERLLEGSAQAREQLPELGIFVDDVQAIAAASPAAETRHIVAMMAEAQLIADKGDPVVRPVSNAHGPAPQVSGLPMRRSTQMLKMLLTKVMAPLVAVFTVMGGLAYAQALPTPVQDAVSGAAGLVGIDLPSSATSDDDDAIDAGTVDDADEDAVADDEANDGHSGSGSDDVATAADDDQDENDQGDDDQGDQGDGDQGDDDQGDDDNSGSGGGSDDAEENDDNSGSGGGSDDADDSDDGDSGSDGGSGSDDIDDDA